MCPAADSSPTASGRVYLFACIFRIRPSAPSIWMFFEKSQLINFAYGSKNYDGSMNSGGIAGKTAAVAVDAACGLPARCVALLQAQRLRRL